MTISSIPAASIPGSTAAPKFTPAEDVENFVAQVESQTIAELLGGGDGSNSATGLAALLGGGDGSNSATGLAALLGGSGSSGTSAGDITSLASIASAYDFAGRLASLGPNPFDQGATTDATVASGSTFDASA